MIRSNVGEVIARLKQGRDRIAPLVEAVIDPSRYHEDLKNLAQRTLEAIAETEVDRMAIPAIMGTYFGQLSATGMEFGMQATPIKELFRPFAMPNFPIREVEKWVEEHKKLDERDRYKSGRLKPIDKIANRVRAALQNDPEPWLRTDWEGRGALNPTGLAQSIGLSVISPKRLRFMLRAVLTAWVTYMLERLPNEAIREIRNAFID